MLHGPMMSKILLFALPLAAGSILQQLFNAVDVAVVGQFASSEALAAVGANTPVVTLLINLFVGISVGSNVVIAHMIGKGEEDHINGAVHTSILLALVSGVFLMFLGILIARPLLTLMSTPENILDMAVLYLWIYCVGMPFILLYNFAAAILRSIGDTRRPLYCLVAAGVINAGLNLLFVIVFHMGVSGVAIATVISNGISSGMAVRFLHRSDSVIRLEWKQLRFQKKELKRILQIGIPAGIQGMVFSIANVCIQSSINSFGSSAVAGSTVAANFEYISYFLVNGFNSAVVTFVSQNYGAGKLKRCKKAFLLGLVCAMVIAFAVNICSYLGRDLLIRLFTSDAEVADYAALRLRYVVLFHCLICTYEITGSALRGLEHSLLPSVLMIFGTCVFRLVYINTVVIRHHEFSVLMMVYPFSWVLTGAMVVIAFLLVWRKVRDSM